MAITFQNKGLIDLTCITTFGISVKDNDDAIGFFGSGLKYAIAIIIRNRGKITLYRGLDKYEFYSKSHDVKGKTFDVIYMKHQDDETQLGFTTRTGINWELWQAFRELYCNALDEHGEVLQETAIPLDDHTTIEVDLNEFDQLYNMRDYIVLPNRFDYKNDRVAIIKRPSKYLYYRNIRAVELQPDRPALFTYNVLYQQTLTEDRTLKYPYVATSEIAHAIAVCNDKEIIQAVLTCDNEYESALPLTAYSHLTSQVFLDTLKELMHLTLKTKHPQFDDLCKALFPKEYQTPDVKLDSIQQRQFDKALEVNLALGFDILEYPVRFKQSLGYNILGEAKDKTIFISMDCFELGTKMLAGTLFEEYVHLKTNHEDNSRGMQNYLINMIMSMTEKYVTKEPI